MEILHKFKQNGYFTAELYHLLAKKKLVDPTEEILPSQYVKEMRLSTAERLENLNNIEIENIVKICNKDQKVVLSFTPRIIVYQNFKPNDKIVAKFSVKNISTGSTFLNMVFKESSYFSIKPCGGQLLSRLAPGMSVTFAVTFIPMQYEDYTHRVTFYTDTDQYVLPLIAMGPRPVFDFPDEVVISKVPLKVENYTFVTVHNVGKLAAGFTLTTKCPFSVQPKSAYLNPDQKIDIRIEFKSMILGEKRGLLYAMFETGENFSIKVSGTTHTVSIELEKQVVRFLDTFNTMVRQQVLKITNKSEHLLTFMCMKNDCVYYDFEDKVKLATVFYNVKGNESAKYMKLVQYDVLSSDEHERVYTRIFLDEIQALVADETLRFQNTNFSITPIKGELWPNKVTEITITFSPKELGEFQSTAYLDIDGVLDRMPLTIIGNSLPPSIHLNVETLDMDCVYINKMYHYEVVAINKGHINGVVVYKEMPTLFGSFIKCTPELHCLRPGDREIFVISFSNSNQGPYFEEINFSIRDTAVIFKLYLKGEVIYPSLMFSTQCLDFGTVSVGVPKTLEFDVINESAVDVAGSVKISSDGPEINSITLAEYAVTNKPKPKIPQWPREFDIEPSKVLLRQESTISIKVTLTANLIRANQTSLELELEKSDSTPIVVPVIFNAMVPHITPAPEIKLRACFLDFHYKHEIKIIANSLWGYFTLDESEESTMEVDISVKEGMIEPNSTICLPATIKTSALGDQEYRVRLHLFGMTQPIEICHITGCGVRPIVTCTPMALHWGQVKLLTKTQKILTLCNDSPVHVKFKASLFNRDGRWHIQPTEGYIKPESETDLVFTLYLLDADTYTNKAVLQLDEVKDILVPLSATGVGTSITVGDLRDKIFLGRHFTKIPLNYKVIMENCGTRMHSLEWSEHYKAPKTKPHTTGFFNLDPKVFKMTAGEKLELTVTGICHKVTTIKEMWYLVGSVEGINKKELLLECAIVGEFVDPKIEVSSSVINFQYDYGPYNEYYKLTDIVTIKNISKLPLDIDIGVKPPFAIVHKQYTYKVMSEEENLCCCIHYNESDLNVPNMVNEAGSHQSNLFIDYLTQKPVEPSRKEPLHFFQDINKIKMAFNLTHGIEERLEDQETMKLQLLFDTTKHASQKSKIYCDVMRIKFKGHKNKDAVKLIGVIHFPNILLLTPRVDFQCLLNGSVESKSIKIQNMTPLLVCYKFQWKKCFITGPTTLDIPKEKSTINNTGKTQKDLISVAQLNEILVSHTHVSRYDKPTNELEIGDLNGVDSVNVNKSKADLQTIHRSITKKILSMIETDYDSHFVWLSKFPKFDKRNKISINDVIQLVPHRGLLKPNEIQYIHVIFMPKEDMNVRAVLELDILGGPSEMVVVTGQSSDLMYNINTQKLNFKIRSFHEMASEQLIITNTAQLPFEYKTYLNETNVESELGANIVDLLPPEKIVEKEEEAKINIVVRPGVLGYFNKTFLLEIGHLPHISIELFGWGVIPQVYLSLPRPEIIKLDPKYGYLAIPDLTDEYLTAVSEFFMKGASEHLNSPLTEKCFEDTDLQQDWHICSSWDRYPSVADIELAIERILVINHIKLRPEILTTYATTSKMRPIPGFHTTPYMIDYGVVITGGTVQCIAEITNYGPIPTKLHFSKCTYIPAWLDVKLCGKLNPGESGRLEIIFSPTSNDFTGLEQHVETAFNLEVPYGVTIPIQIKALCAVPYLVSNVATINFGSVRCGDKIITSIPLKNVGRPTCIWYATLRLKTVGAAPMVVLNSSGKYEPGEGGWLSIAFKPTMEMTYEGLLIFRFHMNPNRMRIPVTGQGILPHVHIIGAHIRYPPTLPWAETTDMYFGLTNPCPFPIELVIAHSDVRWKDEEDLYHLLNKYYNKPDEMLVPAMRPGDGLPVELINFHKKFKAAVQKNIEEEAAAVKALTSRAASSSKKVRSPKNAPKSQTVDIPMKKIRTEAEIIDDEIRNLKEHEVDPLKECLHKFEETSTTSGKSKHLKGVLIFVHGSPCEEMQCQEMAHTIGKELQLPVVNIDHCIVEALCTSNTAAKGTLLSAINEMYQASRKPTNKTDMHENEENSEEIFDENEDEFDIIFKKIECLAISRNVGIPRPKASEKRKKRSPTSSMASHSVVGTTAVGSSTMFHMDLITELLADFFSGVKFSHGFIVDNLSSIMLQSPPLVLTTILKCKNSIWNIHLILCHSDFYKWAHTYEEAQRENDLIDENISKVYDESEIEQIVQSLEHMDDEEYENASPELKSIYIEFGLQQRRRNHRERFLNKTVNDSRKEKHGKDRSKSLLTIDLSESKKKLKKDEAKVAAYAPVSSTDPQELEKFWKTVRGILDLAKANEQIIMCGDLNGWVGTKRSSYEAVLGPYGDKRVNDAGKLTSEYVTMNTKYNEYNKNTYEHLINIANNWNVEACDMGMPLYGFNGQVLGSAHKKAKKKSEIQFQISDVSFTERGFPLTLVMCPCLGYKQAVVRMLAQSPLVQQALKKEEPYDILKCNVKRKEFTVLLPKTFPNIHHEEPLQWRHLDESPLKKCECNQFTDLNLLDDTTQDYVVNILSKWYCTCGKKLTSSITSTSEIPSASIEKTMGEESDSERLYSLPLRSVKSITASDGRLVLQPGDLVRCKYSFSPQIEGTFSVKRFVEVYGWPESRVDINVIGICDLPRLDSRPKKMFENFVRRTHEDNVYKITYLDDRNLFEFGPIFVGSNRVYEEEYRIDLKNSSLITADVVIEFLEETSVFQIDKTSIQLEPGCRGKLKISAAPAEVGVYNSVLLFCIKDNPEIVAVNITCSGVLPIVEILPLTKVIEYGKHLLYRREDDRFIVKNDSILPIMWKISNASEFVEDFIIAQTSGIVSRQDNQVVPVTYIACRVGVITNKILTIAIYDAEGRGDPMVIDHLYLSAECYDVTVECAYENANETFLNYGNVKVNSNVVREMYFLNRGKYNIYFKLKKVKNFPEMSLLRSFEATPESGIIPPTLKLVTIGFECTPTTSMNLVNVPAYVCSLLDGSKNQVVVAKFPICVTIASFYNTFTLFPLGELNFHIIPVGSGVIREVILKNTSKCPITYEIILPQKYQIDPADVPPAKVKDNKIIKNPPVKCGNFLIMNEDNLLAPGTCRTLQIQFMATTARIFEETIHFIISDTCPAEAQGVPLRLVGTGAIPTLDFWNLETTFREHLIVKNLSEYKNPESSPHCVFVEDSVTLHFFCVTVNTSFTGAIDLYNNGLVACALTMNLQYQSNTNKDIFYLDKYETHIEPLMHKFLGIVFSPKALEEYRAVLEVKLKLLDNKEQAFKICLIGEGVIPRIRILTPVLRQQRIGSLIFPVTCLGSVNKRVMRFKNVSLVKSVIVVEMTQLSFEERSVFWLSPEPNCEHIVLLGNKDECNNLMKVILSPKEIASIDVYYNPRRRGKTSCNIKITIVKNPYEYFTVLCEGEAFMEDVILVGLEMLPMDIDLEAYRTSVDGTISTVSTVDSRKKSKSATIRNTKTNEGTKGKRTSIGSRRHSEAASMEHSALKYVLDFGGCELCVTQKRNILMINNSDKVYKFEWEEVDHICIKPSIGYISPGEEKDLEIMFFSVQPVSLKKELLNCLLTAISDDSLTFDFKEASWDNRQIVTLFDHNRDASTNERYHATIDEQAVSPPVNISEAIHIMIVYSAISEYTKYTCTLNDAVHLKDTFIYQMRNFDFQVQNVGNVALKIKWGFCVDDDFPARIDKYVGKEVNDITDSANTLEEVNDNNSIKDGVQSEPEKKYENVGSKETLFSNSTERKSVDTWFDIDLPFTIEPVKECIKSREIRTFRVTFKPTDAFQFKVKLQSYIDNLDPYDQNTICKITARSLVPYCHLDIPVSDYLTSGRRKTTGVTLPPHMAVLEFNVLGSGCYKKSFNVINPTSDGYEFNFEMIISDKPELIPVHCNTLKGYVEGGTYSEITFTFSPTAPGTYESQWKFNIPIYNLTINLLVVGLVREPDAAFVPTILIIRNSLVGFTTSHTVVIRNNENESLNFEFKGNSLFNELGETPVVVEPTQGILKPRSETQINIIYTAIQDGPLSFKIYCNVKYMTKFLTLCVNALSYLIKPKVTYYLIGNEHVLNSEVVTNIHLDQTASTYQRTIPFRIKNDGSATFFFDWHYNSKALKKYLQINIEPKNGHVVPANEVACTLYFTLKQVPVQAFPVTLSISDGLEYSICLYAEIKKPLYHFTCTEFDFGKCFINAPDTAYKKNIGFINDDTVPLIYHLSFTSVPELYVDFVEVPQVEPGKRMKIPIYFRPKQVKQYEFKLQFWVNSLCEEIITIKGEGVPILFDLYEGCQKSFDLGPVKVGEKIIRSIEVMNHSKVPIEATFIFRDMYPEVQDTVNSETTSVCLSPSVTNLLADAGPSRVKMLQSYKDNKVKEQIATDIQNALASLKVVPNKCVIQPHRKVLLKIQFKPVGIISTLNVQLNMKVFEFERPLVRLSGSATGMKLCFSQNSLQFGRVRKRGCKILKVMLLNKGDFGTRFWWQPLTSEEFKISPMEGTIAAHTNVTFTIAFRPVNHNPFIKVWASCNIENYTSLELAMYATCVDIGNVQNKTLYLECPVREVQTEYITVTNPSDDRWLILSEMSGGPFETPREFHVEPNSTFDIPVHFKPKTIGKHESLVLYSPLGESALFVSLVGAAIHPNPNGTITLSVPAKHVHSEDLLVHNITEFSETYVVSTEIVKVIPDKFEGYFEIKHPATIKVWGEAAATCRWSFACYEECEMHMKVMFINEESREYQYYNIVGTVTPSLIVDTLKFVARAREMTQQELLVANPLAEDADFFVRCDKLTCPEKIRINRNSEAMVTLTYSPLVVGESNVYLEVSNQLVGSYLYKVILKCLPAIQKNLEYTTSLGDRIPLRLRVQNNTETKTDFVTEVSHPSIQAQSQYTLGPFEKGKFLVWFEPTEIGIQNCRLSFNSLVAGEFVFHINGQATVPKPQGPYEIKVGGCTMIKFKNVFEDTRMFRIYVDREEFYVKTLYEPVKGKKEIMISVYLNDAPLQGWTEMPTGCLTIECYEPAEPKAHWTYFLQGVS